MRWESVQCTTRCSGGILSKNTKRFVATKPNAKAEAHAKRNESADMPLGCNANAGICDLRQRRQWENISQGPQAGKKQCDSTRMRLFTDTRTKTLHATAFAPKLTRQIGELVEDDALIEMIDDFDANGDGEIDPEEFLSIMTQQD